MQRHQTHMLPPWQQPPPSFESTAAVVASQGQMYAPVQFQPEQYDMYAVSHQTRVDPETGIAPWFLSGVPRKQVRHIVSNMSKNGVEGNFVVRDVESSPGCYGLCVKSPKGIGNYLIEVFPYERHIGGIGYCILSTLLWRTHQVFPHLMYHNWYCMYLFKLTAARYGSDIL